MNWLFRAGATWDDKLSDFCGDPTNNFLWATYPDLIDLTITEGDQTWVFELTHLDLHSKLYPKEGSTSLIEELDRLQGQTNARQYHICTLEGLMTEGVFNSRDLMVLVSQMAQFPSVKLLIYGNQQSALKGIANLVKENRPWSRPQGLPVKKTQVADDPVVRFLMTIDGITAEKAVQVREYMLAEDCLLFTAMKEYYPDTKRNEPSAVYKRVYAAVSQIMNLREGVL